MHKKEICEKCKCDVFCIHKGRLYCINHHKQNKLIFYGLEKINNTKKIKDCEFCGCEKCQCKKTHRGIKINLIEGELNALEDLGSVDLKSMYLLGREKELEEWQKRCFSFWKRIVKKVDYGNV